LRGCLPASCLGLVTSSALMDLAIFQPPQPKTPVACRPTRARRCRKARARSTGPIGVPSNGLFKLSEFLAKIHAMKRAQKITNRRNAGDSGYPASGLLRRLQVRAFVIDSNRWPDHVRLFDLERYRCALGRPRPFSSSVSTIRDARKYKRLPIRPSCLARPSRIGIASKCGS
jgi:hypothetical protein